jgi:hypothetical protein
MEALANLEIIIMSHERPEFLQRALAALEMVDFGSRPKITISDNPSKISSRVPREIVRNYNYVLRDGLGATSHLNKIISEVKSEWTLITHDDDEILPQLGDLFREYSSNPKIGMITGRSLIIDSTGNQIISNAYESRLRKSNLNNFHSHIKSDVFWHLFDLGSLFPASAMIIRREVYQEIQEVNLDVNLASDYSLSLKIAKNHNIVFEGINPVMKYWLHGKNSVYSNEAMSSLKSELTIARLVELANSDFKLSLKRNLALSKQIFESTILLNTYGEYEKISILNRYILTYEELKGKLAFSRTFEIKNQLFSRIVKFEMQRRLKK